MKIKILSLAALVGITGLFISKMNSTDENIKISKYSPRVADNVTESYEAKGAAEYLASIRGDYKTGVVDPILLEKAQNHAYDKSSRGSNLGLEFEFMGPSNMGGRTRGVVVDNENSSKIYGASITGGIYISTNGGNTWAKSWSARTNNVSCLAQATNGYIYAGTGCSFEGGSGGGAPGGTGVGIYVSKDRGITWNILESTSNADKVFFRAVNYIVAHPTDANTLAAATNGGVQVSTDGGVTWSRNVACNGSSGLANCTSVDWSSDGKLLHAGFSGGQYYSGTDWTSNCGLIKQTNVGDGGRWMLSASPNNPKTVYATTATPPGGYSDVKISSDGGENWASFNPPMPVSASNFDLYGNNGGGQANYDMLFKAVPNPADNSKDMLFLGGVQLWRYDGNWTQAAVGGGSGSEPGLYKVHVDHHTVTYDKKNPKNVYFGNDGGIYKSQDGGYTFFDMNKGYSVIQYYSIAYARFDYAVGGTQDNGNPYLTPHRPGNPTYGTTVFNQGVLNGDGFDAAVSQIVDLKYVSSQYGNMGRGKVTSTQGSGACAPYCGMGSFYTYLRLWENENDLTSKDSVLFKVDTTAAKMGLGTGSRTTFEGQIIPSQQAAQVIIGAGAIKIGTNLDKLVYDGNGGFTGNGKGTLDEKTLKFSVTFNSAPPLNAIINAYYAANYAAGSVIIVPSATENLPIRHVLNTNLGPGDFLKVQDPVQSLIAIQVNQKCSLNNNGTGYDCDDPGYPINNRPSSIPSSGTRQPGLAVARKGIALGKNPDWMHLNLGRVQEFEFSPNGDELYYNPNGNSTVRLVEGINDLYTQADADKITSKEIFNSRSGNVTSMSFNPNNPDEMLVTVGNYGAVKHVFLLTRIPNTSNFTNKDVTGDLPDMPVYDAIFDHINPKRVILGTDQGVYSTQDIGAAAVEWAAEDFALVPVFDIDQQVLPFNKASNAGMVYFGTHGAGIWKSATIVGIDEIDHKEFNSGLESSIVVYPNPIQNSGQLQLTVSNPDDALINIYSVNGQLQKTIKPSLHAGENDVAFDVSELTSGTYFVTLMDGSTKKVAKFIKM